MANSNPEKTSKKNKKRLSQTDVPAYSLEEALKVPLALHENYAGGATKPIDVAAAMDISPASSIFKMLTGSSIAYGLTEGGAQSQEISLTDLAKQIVQPLEERQDLNAKREALLKPRVVGEFLKKYDGSQIPKNQIAKNVLMDMGVPKDRTTDVLSMILEGSESLGLITDIKGKKYINLRPQNSQTSTPLSSDNNSDYENETQDKDIGSTATPEDISQIQQTPVNKENNKKVFITHGKNKLFIDPIKKLLSFGEMEPVVSAEKQSVSEPVPDKVMNDMRDCGAAIIHVEDELTLVDKDANEHVILNSNVLIEIGAAMALYKKRFILLVKEGVKLPSNLQGLYEVRYSGEIMDSDTTIKLLEAINAMKAEK